MNDIGVLIYSTLLIGAKTLSNHGTTCPMAFLPSNDFPAVFNIEGELGSGLFVSSFKPVVTFEQIVNNRTVVPPLIRNSLIPIDPVLFCFYHGNNGLIRRSAVGRVGGCKYMNLRGDIRCRPYSVYFVRLEVMVCVARKQIFVGTVKDDLLPNGG